MGMGMGMVRWSGRVAGWKEPWCFPRTYPLSSWRVHALHLAKISWVEPMPQALESSWIPR